MRGFFLGLGLVFLAGTGMVHAQESEASSEMPAASQIPVPTPAVDSVAPGEPRKGWDWTAFGHIPLQSGGRVKPLDSFAQELVLFLTGSRKYEGWDPKDLLLSWIATPEAWEERPILQLQNREAKRQIGLPEERNLFSPKEVTQESHLGQYAEALQKPLPPGAKDTTREKSLKELLARLGSYRSIVGGFGWPVIPVPSPDAWKSLAEEDSEGTEIRQGFAQMVMAYRVGDQARFEAAALETQKKVEAKMGGEWTSEVERKISAEYFFNHFRPFLWSWIFYLMAALLGAISVVGKKHSLSRIAVSFGIFAFVVQCGAMTVRSWIAGRPPVTNMYESIVWVGFGVFFLALLIFWKNRQTALIAIASAVSAFTLIAADAAPTVMDPSIQPLVPVLRSNLWLTIHVLTITLGYSAFALSLGLGNVTLFHFLRGAKTTDPRVNELNHLNYRAVQFGVVLLAAGTILGGVWADYSWGRFWGWDPKETWALIALLIYLAILHGRYTGAWISTFSFSVWTVISFLSVLMAWYGVNFVLGAGLHSYGFASGGQGTVVAFILLQLAYVGAVAGVRKFRKGSSQAK